jgi:hypothetical protein
MSKLRTVWDGHWREGEYLGFVRWALGNEAQRRQYRDATGDTFEPSAGNAAMNEQVASGEALAYLQRYSDWLTQNVFGTPDEPIDKLSFETKRVLH